MAYAPPTITAAGLTIPSYQDILQYLINHTTAIYGNGDYLQNDSADYQALSIFALLLSDAMQAAQIDYWNRGPVTAIGAGLDGIVKLNGLARKAATYSTCPLLVTGTAGTVISNGVAQDLNGFQWALPSTVTIPSPGTITVTSTCTILGAIHAPQNTIVIRATPTAGWLDVNNTVPAIAGLPVEPDMSLRARQAISVAIPSQTRLQGTIAAIAATLNVTRYNVQENPTNLTDAWGNPPHSITATVEGGADADIAKAIYNNRSIGCYTNGTTVVTVVDPMTGVTVPMRFNRPVYVPFTVVCNVHVFYGDPSYWATATQTVIVNYLNSLQIGEMLTTSGIYAVVMNLNADLDNPEISVRGLTTGYTSCVLTVALGSASGSNYVVGDTLTILQPGSSNTVQVTVSSVATGGKVNGVSGLLQNGTGYASASNLSTSGGTGNGCTLTITAGTVQDTTDKGVAPSQVVQGLATNVTVNIV